MDKANSEPVADMSPNLVTVSSSLPPVWLTCGEPAKRARLVGAQDAQARNIDVACSCDWCLGPDRQGGTVGPFRGRIFNLPQWFEHCTGLRIVGLDDEEQASEILDLLLSAVSVSRSDDGAGPSTPESFRDYLYRLRRKERRAVELAEAAGVRGCDQQRVAPGGASSAATGAGPDAARPNRSAPGGGQPGGPRAGSPLAGLRLHVFYWAEGTAGEDHPEGRWYSGTVLRERKKVPTLQVRWDEWLDPEGKVRPSTRGEVLLGVTQLHFGDTDPAVAAVVPLPSAALAGPARAAAGAQAGPHTDRGTRRAQEGADAAEAGRGAEGAGTDAAALSAGLAALRPQPGSPAPKPRKLRKGSGVSDRPLEGAQQDVPGNDAEAQREAQQRKRERRERRRREEQEQLEQQRRRRRQEGEQPPAQPSSRGESAPPGPTGNEPGNQEAMATGTAPNAPPPTQGAPGEPLEGTGQQQRPGAGAGEQRADGANAAPPVNKDRMSLEEKRRAKQERKKLRKERQLLRQQQQQQRQEHEALGLLGEQTVDVPYAPNRVARQPAAASTAPDPQQRAEPDSRAHAAAAEQPRTGPLPSQPQPPPAPLAAKQLSSKPRQDKSSGKGSAPGGAPPPYGPRPGVAEAVAQAAGPAAAAAPGAAGQGSAQLEGCRAGDAAAPPPPLSVAPPGLEGTTQPELERRKRRPKKRLKLKGAGQEERQETRKPLESLRQDEERQRKIQPALGNVAAAEGPVASRGAGPSAEHVGGPEAALPPQPPQTTAEQAPAQAAPLLGSEEFSELNTVELALQLAERSGREGALLLDEQARLREAAKGIAVKRKKRRRKLRAAEDSGERSCPAEAEEVAPGREAAAAAATAATAPEAGSASPGGVAEAAHAVSGDNGMAADDDARGLIGGVEAEPGSAGAAPAEAHAVLPAFVLPLESEPQGCAGMLRPCLPRIGGTQPPLHQPQPAQRQPSGNPELPQEVPHHLAPASCPSTGPAVAPERRTSEAGAQAGPGLRVACDVDPALHPEQMAPGHPRLAESQQLCLRLTQRDEADAALGPQPEPSKEEAQEPVEAALAAGVPSAGQPQGAAGSGAAPAAAPAQEAATSRQTSDSGESHSSLSTGMLSPGRQRCAPAGPTAALGGHAAHGAVHADDSDASDREDAAAGGRETVQRLLAAMRAASGTDSDSEDSRGLPGAAAPAGGPAAPGVLPWAGLPPLVSPRVQHSAVASAPIEGTGQQSAQRVSRVLVPGGPGAAARAATPAPDEYELPSSSDKTDSEGGSPVAERDSDSDEEGVGGEAFRAAGAGANAAEPTRAIGARAGGAQPQELDQAQRPLQHEVCAQPRPQPAPPQPHSLGQVAPLLRLERSRGPRGAQALHPSWFSFGEGDGDGDDSEAAGEQDGDAACADAGPAGLAVPHRPDVHVPPVRAAADAEATVGATGGAPPPGAPPPEAVVAPAAANTNAAVDGSSRVPERELPEHPPPQIASAASAAPIGAPAAAQGGPSVCQPEQQAACRGEGGGSDGRCRGTEQQLGACGAAHAQPPGLRLALPPPSGSFLPLLERRLSGAGDAGAGPHRRSSSDGGPAAGRWDQLQRVVSEVASRLAHVCHAGRSRQAAQRADCASAEPVLNRASPPLQDQPQPSSKLRVSLCSRVNPATTSVSPHEFRALQAALQLLAATPRSALRVSGPEPHPHGPAGDPLLRVPLPADLPYQYCLQLAVADEVAGSERRAAPVGAPLGALGMPTLKPGSSARGRGAAQQVATTYSVLRRAADAGPQARAEAGGQAGTLRGAEVAVEVQLVACALPGVELHKVELCLRLRPGPAAPGGRDVGVGSCGLVDWRRAVAVAAWLGCGLCQVAALPPQQAAAGAELLQQLLEPRELLAALPQPARPPAPERDVAPPAQALAMVGAITAERTATEQPHVQQQQLHEGQTVEGTPAAASVDGAAGLAVGGSIAAPNGDAGSGEGAVRAPGAPVSGGLRPSASAPNDGAGGDTGAGPERFVAADAVLAPGGLTAAAAAPCSAASTLGAPVLGADSEGGTAGPDNDDDDPAAFGTPASDFHAVDAEPCGDGGMSTGVTTAGDSAAVDATARDTGTLLGTVAANGPASGGAAAPGRGVAAGRGAAVSGTVDGAEAAGTPTGDGAAAVGSATADGAAAHGEGPTGDGTPATAAAAAFEQHEAADGVAASDDGRQESGALAEVADGSTGILAAAAAAAGPSDAVDAAVDPAGLEPFAGDEPLSEEALRPVFGAAFATGLLLDAEDRHNGVGAGAGGDGAGRPQQEGQSLQGGASSVDPQPSSGAGFAENAVAGDAAAALAGTGQDGGWPKHEQGQVGAGVSAACEGVAAAGDAANARGDGAFSAAAAEEAEARARALQMNPLLLCTLLEFGLLADLTPLLQSLPVERLQGSLDRCGEVLCEKATDAVELTAATAGEGAAAAGLDRHGVVLAAFRFAALLAVGSALMRTSQPQPGTAAGASASSPPSCDLVALTWLRQLYWASRLAYRTEEFWQSLCRLRALLAASPRNAVGTVGATDWATSELQVAVQALLSAPWPSHVRVVGAGNAGPHLLAAAWDEILEAHRCWRREQAEGVAEEEGEEESAAAKGDGPGGAGPESLGRRTAAHAPQQQQQQQQQAQQQQQVQYQQQALHLPVAAQQPLQQAVALARLSGMLQRPQPLPQATPAGLQLSQQPWVQQYQQRVALPVQQPRGGAPAVGAPHGVAAAPGLVTIRVLAWTPGELAQGGGRNYSLRYEYGGVELESTFMVQAEQEPKLASMAGQQREMEVGIVAASVEAALRARGVLVPAVVMAALAAEAVTLADLERLMTLRDDLHARGLAQRPVPHQQRHQQQQPRQGAQLIQRPPGVQAAVQAAPHAAAAALAREQGPTRPRGSGGWRRASTTPSAAAQGHG